MSLGPFDPHSQKKVNAQKIAESIKYGSSPLASHGNSQHAKDTGIGAG